MGNDMMDANEPKFSRLLSLIITVLLLAASAASGQTNSKTNNHPLCQAIAAGKLQASSGALMWCFGPQPNGPNNPLNLKNPPGFGTGFTSDNVDAASLSEDITPSGARASGQSETSIAAVGPYVVEGWNDATGFFSPCPSANNKEELSGFGFSSNGGKTFTDLGGLPNTNCANNVYSGDPSVEAYRVGGKTYFYISGLYPPTFSNTNPFGAIAVTACQVLPGPPATLSCSQPIIAAASSDCTSGFCSFLDKDFMTLDAVHGRLYVSYTEFGVTSNFEGQIELAACDIGNKSGGPGPLGGTPALPVCENGSAASSTAPPPPYLIVAPGDNVNFCEHEGAYPAADPANGDVYVAHEYNWVTDEFGACESIAHQAQVAYVANSCLTLPTASCSGPSATTSIPITSLDLTEISGYNRGIGNDFPRIAVSDANGTVSVVWNDARSNPYGDILLQSLDLVSLGPVQSAPVKLNNDNGIGTLHFLPALRNVDADGDISVSWYDRRGNPNSALTDVYAALDVNPKTTSTPSSNTRVTSVATDWLSVGSIIIPNFG
ncbi:MAG TPA: hypothetical protein VG206_06855, partial [Terriglobia bacterium]|nr:hypothetical protein [Terriglobia bacterium]